MSETLQRDFKNPRTPLEHDIARLGPWFHNLHLPEGYQTAPDHPLGDFPHFKWQELAPHLLNDMKGWEVLDVGCNAGYYSFQLAQRGARVTAIDVDDHYLQQARWAARLYRLESRIDFQRREVYEVATLAKTFDLVLFMGVFYHLRYPLLALDILAQKTAKWMVFQTLSFPDEEDYEVPQNLDLQERHRMQDAGWPKMCFIPHQLAGDATNWWAPNHTGIQHLLRSSGLHVEKQIAHEMYLCRRDAEGPDHTHELAAAAARYAAGGRR